MSEFHSSPPPISHLRQRKAFPSVLIFRKTRHNAWNGKMMKTAEKNFVSKFKTLEVWPLPQKRKKLLNFENKMSESSSESSDVRKRHSEKSDQSNDTHRRPEISISVPPGLGRSNKKNKGTSDKYRFSKWAHPTYNRSKKKHRITIKKRLSKKMTLKKKRYKKKNVTVIRIKLLHRKK